MHLLFESLGLDYIIQPKISSCTYDVNSQHYNSYLMEKIRIPAPDDWHVHFREGALLPLTLLASSRCFNRCVAMPNLTQPLINARLVQDYAAAIHKQLPTDTRTQPLFTLYLTEALSGKELKESQKIKNFFAVKWYPVGTTTHSTAGVRDIRECYKLLEAMEEQDIPLLIHGETVSDDVFDRERLFIEKELPQLRARFSQLRITLEHISSKEAVDYLKESSEKTAATLTAHHLKYNRNDMLGSQLKPHLYCKPLLKRERDRLALCELVASGFNRVFLGSDSAPHLRAAKETDHGCAGVFSAPFLMEIYTDIFAELGILRHLANFASRNGANFYQFPITQHEIELIQKPCKVPFLIKEHNMELVPMAAGETLNWSLNVKT